MATAVVKILGQDALKQPLQQASKEVQSFGNVAEKVGDTLKKAFAFTAIIATAKKVVDGLTDCFHAFNEADRAYRQLSIALNDSEGFDSVKDNIAQLSKITLSSKGDIEAMASELAGLGKSSSEINKIIEAAVHLSNVTGKDLNSSMTTLLNTYNGTTTQLNRLGIDTSNLTKEELAQGAAIELVTEKFGELSRAMAEDDSEQHIKNIKDNLGDIGQSLGQIVNTSFAPLFKNLDEFSGTFKDKVQEWADTVSIFIQNIGVIWSHFWTALKGSLETWWKNISNIEGIKNIVNNIFTNIYNKIKLVGDIAANLGNLFYGVWERALKAIGNLAMSWITGITDSIGINISDVINKIGDWMLESPVGKIIDNILTKAYNGVMTIVTIIKNIPSIMKIVFNYLGDIISTFVREFPTGIKAALKGIGNAILGGILNIKNSFLQTVEDALNSIGEWISNSWVGKAMKWMGLDLGEKLANIDFGVDRTKQYEYENRSRAYFKEANAAFTGTKELSKEMAQEIDKLLTPQIQKIVFGSDESIAKSLATWTAKSSEEYLEEAKKNFKDIGTFLEDWGATFLGDLNEDWTGLKDSFTTFFEGEFGGNMTEFIDWLKIFMQEQKVIAQQNSNIGSGSGSGTGSSSSSPAGEETEEKKHGPVGQVVSGVISGLSNGISEGLEEIDKAATQVLNDFTGQMGEAGDLINRLVSNMTQYTPILGLIITALHYVIEGLVEFLGDIFNEFVKYGLEPLRAIGRVIGDILMPLLESFMPSIQQSADILIQIFEAIGVVLKPIAQLLGTVLGPVLEMITSFLEYILLPVIKGIAIAFSIVTSVFEWAANWIRYGIAKIVNFFGGHADESRPLGFAGTLEKNALNIWYGTGVGTGLDAYGVSGTTNASYQGSTTVYLNVYNYGNVVGDNGITEFAVIIRDEIENLNYFNR